MQHDKDTVSLLMGYVKGGSIFDLISNKGPLQEEKVSK